MFVNIWLESFVRYMASYVVGLVSLSVPWDNTTCYECTSECIQIENESKQVLVRIVPVSTNVH